MICLAKLFLYKLNHCSQKQLEVKYQDLNLQVNVYQLTT